MDTLRENLVFFLVMLPFVGAWLVQGVSHLGSEVVRKTALTNIVMTSLLAVLTFFCYRPFEQDEDGEQQPSLQMVTSLRWVGQPIQKTTATDSQTDSYSARQGPNIRLAFGADGLSIGFLLVIPLLMIPAVQFAPTGSHEPPPSFFALLLGWESVLLGVFAATDVMTFIVLLGWSLVLSSALLGSFGGHGRRKAVRKAFLFQTAGLLLIVFGLIGLVGSHYWLSWLAGEQSALTFSTSRLIPEIQWMLQGSDYSEYWKGVALPITTCLGFGFLILSASFPLHTWFPAVSEESPHSVSLFLSSVCLSVGGYGLLRFVLPICGSSLLTSNMGSTALHHWMFTFALLGVILFSLLALGQSDLRRLTTYACLARMSLSLTAILSLTWTGMTGGLLGLIQIAMAWGIVLSLIGFLEDRYHTRDLQAFGGLFRHSPRWSILLLVGVGSLLAIPGLGGESNTMMSLAGIFQLGATQGVWAILALVVFAWAMFNAIEKTFLGPHRLPLLSTRLQGVFDRFENGEQPSTPKSEPRDLSWPEVISLLPCVAVLVVMSIFPSQFVKRIEPSLVSPTQNRQLNWLSATQSTPNASSLDNAQTGSESDPGSLSTGEHQP